MGKGILYLCATPIGNLEDITYRAVRILKEVNVIAAEDTRHTLKLLNHYGINTPITSYHKFNIKQKTPILINKLNMGENIAVVSDAGMPGISDPGSELVVEAIKENIQVVPIPGPTAFITALVASGLKTDSFYYCGFIPSKKSSRKKYLQELENLESTLVFYEAPHRLIDTLEEMLLIYGDRNVCVSRELTKKFEEFKRGAISEVLDYYKREGVRGEITLLVEGAKDEFTNTPPEMDELVNEVEQLVLKGIFKKEAIKQVADKYNISKNILYKEFHK